MMVDWKIPYFLVIHERQTRCRRATVSCRKIHNDAVKKRFVVHALDDEDWRPRFLRNCSLQTIGQFRSSI